MKLPALPARRRLFAILGLAVAAVVAVALLAAWGSRRGSAQLVTAVARRGELVVDIATTGQVEALRSRSVGRKRTGWSWNAAQIAQLAPEGSVVKAGDFLAQLDVTEAKQQLDQAENTLLNRRADLEKKKAESEAKLAEMESERQNLQYSYEQAKLRYDLMKFEAEVRRREQELELKKAELALQGATDRLKSQRIISEAEVSAAQYEVRNAEMQAAAAREALESLTITAPEPGLVVYKSYRSGKVKVGDQVWPGMELIELPDLSQMQVRTRVNEVDVRQVAVGQEVLVSVDALAGQRFHGKVSRIATLARTEGDAKVKVFDVDVLLEGPAGELRPGMTAQCRIIVTRLPDVVYVPLEAVFEREGKSVVFAGGRGGEPRPVELGARSDDFVVVTSGLAAGETVALRDPAQPEPASAPASAPRAPRERRSKEARP